MGIFADDGTLQTGWTTGKNISEQRRLLGIALRAQKIRLCSPTGSDLTDDIFEVLESPKLDYVTDILVQTDESGNYQALLLGGRETITDHITFHIIYLCSIMPRGGVTLINKVKSSITSDSKIQSITLEPLGNVVGYYEKQGFRYMDKEDGDTMIWRPTSGAKRTRRKKLRKTRRKSKQ